MKNKILILLAVAAFALAGATGMVMMSCDDKPKSDPKPKCDCDNNVHNGACPAPCPGKGINPPCDCRDPITCDCPDEATHLEVGASDVKCPADNCKHTGDCTEKVNEMLGNGTTTIVKGAGVDSEDFDALVSTFNDLANNPTAAIVTSFNANVVEVRVLPTGSGISYQTQTKVLSVGCDETGATIVPYLINEGIIQISQIQPQTKNTFLADKGNKGREWVAKLMNDRIASVNDFRNVAYDKARGISI